MVERAAETVAEIRTALGRWEPDPTEPESGSSFEERRENIRG
jgi:hypothetical protein